MRNIKILYQRLVRSAISSTPLYHVVLDCLSGHPLLFHKLIPFLSKANNVNSTLHMNENRYLPTPQKMEMKHISVFSS